MKIALFTAYLNSHETKAFQRTADKLGYEFTLIPTQSLIIKQSREGSIMLNLGSNVTAYQKENEELKLGLNIATQDQDLEDFDAVLVRGANRSEEVQRAKLKPLLYEYYAKRGIPVLNGVSSTLEVGNKLFQHNVFGKNGIPVVPTTWVASEELLEEATSEMEFPVFVKEFRGSHGAKTNVPASVGELRELYKSVEMPAYMLIQEKLKTNWDIRVIVVGDKVLGGMKRTAAEGSHVSNYSAGGSIELVELSEEEKELALRAAKSLEAEYGGADLMRDDKGNIYVLEFNRNASFKGFEEATGIDVPEQVYEYLKTQVKK